MTVYVRRQKAWATQSLQSDCSDVQVYKLTYIKNIVKNGGSYNLDLIGGTRVSRVRLVASLFFPYLLYTHALIIIQLIYN